jgi:4-diphosphocytidyl-2-C-methyl-D-erythritol kinase
VPAKINVALAVGPLRPDGYHDLATIFHGVSLWDDVAAKPADNFELEVVGHYVAGVPRDDTNLALRAARLLAKRAGVAGGVHLRVRKEIPVAGGLAGGSADAAGALLACSRLWNVAMSAQELCELAAEVGSDVPFALRGGTALGEGRGERLRALHLSRRLYWVIVAARGGLSTPSVFRRLDELNSAPGTQSGTQRGIQSGTQLNSAPGARRPAQLPESALNAVQTGDAHAVARIMGNDLQAAAVDVRPDLAATLGAGADAGALGGIVSGSGPTCVFIADDEAHAEVLAQRLRAAGVGERVMTAFGPVSPETWLTD